MNKPQAAAPASRPRDFSALDAALAATAAEMDAALETLLPQPSGSHGRVQEAIRYAVFACGKRLRPFLVRASAGLFGISSAAATRAGAAVEVLHTYSLVHDDLPCMDDDVLRRGKPTTHVQFDEATAVLAGDGLLTFAFEVMVAPETHGSSETRCLLATRLAQA